MQTATIRHDPTSIYKAETANSNTSGDYCRAICKEIAAESS
jgi:hypothetical protein